MQTDAFQAMLDSRPMCAELIISGTQSTITVRDDHIIQGSLSVDRYGGSGDTIEIGSTIAAELEFTLDNSTGTYDNFIFEGAEIELRLLIYRTASAVYQFTSGYFTVDDQPRKLQNIKIKALDRMMRFDRLYDSNLSYPATLKNILLNACTNCNITLTTPSSTIDARLKGYTVATKPTGDTLTYRQIVQWICELTGACAFIGHRGYLILTWYDISAPEQFTSSGYTAFGYINPADRYISGNSDVQENDVVITGVRIIGNDDDNTEYLYGSTAYALNIEGNLLAQDNLSTLVNSLGSRITGFHYRPYSCTTKSFPHLFPFDGVTYVDKYGNSHQSIVTNHTYRLNGGSILSGKGKTATQNGYATASPLTKAQQAILEKTAKLNANKLTTLQQAQLDLNASIAGGMGLYTTTITADGVSKTYNHDGTTLAGSSYIFTHNSRGFAWTNNWNNGYPVWNYGFTADGNAVLNTLAAYKISANLIYAGTISSVSGNSWLNLDNGTFSFGSSSLEWSGSELKIKGTVTAQYDSSNRKVVMFGASYDKPLRYIEGLFWTPSSTNIDNWRGTSSTIMSDTTARLFSQCINDTHYLTLGAENIYLNASKIVSLNSPIGMPNDTSIQGANTSGSYKNLIKISDNNNLVAGESGINSFVYGSEIRLYADKIIRFYINGSQVAYVNSTGVH